MLAIAIIKNDKNQILLHECFDTVKNETFYRPLGGGIEFGEKGEDALVRELLEEIGQEIRIIRLIKTFENIFTYEGKSGHEIVLVYKAEIISAPILESYEIVESEKVIAKAVWRSLSEIRSQNANLYPLGIDSVI